MNKRIFVLSLGLSAFIACTAAAADPKEVTNAEIKQQLEALNRRLDSIEAKVSLPDGSSLALKKILEELGDMKKRVADLEGKAPYISKRIDYSKQESLKNGKVKFTNEWVEEVTVLVNGSSYSILPGNELTVSVPAGRFNYRVLELQPRWQTRTVEADKTWTVEINAR